MYICNGLVLHFRHIFKPQNVVHNIMNDEKKYQYSWGNNLVNLNSLSPNKKYFYQIQEPEDFYWGYFIAKISFLDINQNLIYFNNNYYACPINSGKENDYKYVSYSECGEFAYFSEFKDFENSYHVLINLKDKKFKRVKKKSDRSYSLSNFTNDGFKKEDLKLFEKKEWIDTPKNKHHKRFFFFFNIWFPKI